MTSTEPSNIVLEREFMQFLLNANAKQCNYLIKNLTDSQTRALCEVAFNLSILELPSSVKKKVQKCSNLFKKLTKKNTSIRTKAKLLKLNSAEFYKCLLASKEIIVRGLE